MRIAKATNIEEVRHVALEWKATCNAGSMGITIDMEVYLSNLSKLITRDNAELFMLLDRNDKVVGYIGVESFYSPLDNQKVANEHHWYVTGENRGMGSLLLVRAIRAWAKKNDCSHLIVTSSTLASNLHDKVCKFYERIGMRKFETSYIQEIR